MTISTDLLKEARKRAGLSQAELARRTGRAQSAVARWERGDVEPRLSTLVELVRACGLELTFGLDEYDNSYLVQIDRMLALSPLERISRGARAATALAELRSRIEAERHG
jgi:transcriptional regulator with XRE-family HTH domain